MTNAFGFVGGILLIGLSFILLINALPNMMGAIDTSPGHTLENISATSKNIFQNVELFISILPFVLFFVGLALVVGSK